MRMQSGIKRADCVKQPQIVCQAQANSEWRMLKSPFEPCIPMPRGITVPAGSDWIHEIKYYDHRLIVQREDKRVRLWTRNGHD